MAIYIGYELLRPKIKSLTFFFKKFIKIKNKNNLNKKRKSNEQ